MSDEILHLRKIGVEKAKVLDKAFDQVYDFYKRKAEDMGYWGDLKFIKEKSRVFIYTIIENYDDNLQEYPLNGEDESELDD
jgi:hypothetical protein